MRAPIDIDEYAKNLPLSVEEMKELRMPQQFIDRVCRLRGMYTYWLQFPNKKTADMVMFAEQQFKVCKTQAYEDIALVKVLLGDLQASTKQFWRWRINTMIEADHQAARRDKDWRAVASMQKNLILNNKTDKEDPVELEYDKIVPQIFEMTDDINIVIPGKKKTPRKKIEELLKKYGRSESLAVEDADFEEVSDE